MLFMQGFFLSLSLIVAIGAQNAFIIKQGLLKNHIFIVSSICFLCDIVLMLVGIFGVGEFLAKNPIMQFGIAGLGAIFVFYYGFLALKSALFSSVNSVVLKEDSSNASSLQKTIFLSLAFSLLNPHVYLDTVFIMGAFAITFNEEEKIIFALGALSASFLWFFSLGYAAYKLSPWLRKLSRIIDALIACMMFFIGYTLISHILISI